MIHHSAVAEADIVSLGTACESKNPAGTSKMFTVLSGLQTLQSVSLIFALSIWKYELSYGMLYG
jgi:hypothetical protein